MSLREHALAAASLLAITSNLLLWSGPLIVLGLVKLLLPKLRDRAERLLARIYRAAVRVDDWWLGRVIGIRWNRPDLDLDPDRRYLVISNHVSWSDVLLIQSVIVGDGPLLKFLVKRELFVIPILGLVFWAFDFPVLDRGRRSNGDDSDRRRKNMEALLEASRVVLRTPAAVMNFVEGTRWTEAKHMATASPYRHLLAPRVGGFHALLENLGSELEALIDLTLVYPRNVSFWAFLGGRVREVEIVAAKLDVASIPRSREGAGRWLAERWAEKDATIERRRGAGAPVDREGPILERPGQVRV
jgi:1-acyl-sn-glycerol-3-phosphate acyltransferase